MRLGTVGGLRATTHKSDRTKARQERRFIASDRGSTPCPNRESEGAKALTKVLQGPRALQSGGLPSSS